MRSAILLSLLLVALPVQAKRTASTVQSPTLHAMWKAAASAPLAEDDLPQDLMSFPEAVAFFLKADSTTLMSTSFSPQPLMPSLKFKALTSVLSGTYNVPWLLNYNFWNHRNELIPPIFSDLPVDVDKAETFPTQAVIFATSAAGTPLMIAVSEDWFELYFHRQDEQAAMDFVEEVSAWCKRNNFYKNRPLIYMLEFWEWGDFKGGHFDFFSGAGKEDLSWDQLILPEKTKQRVRFETEDFARNFEQHEKEGVSTKRGVLLVGPPGTGKTLINRVLFSRLRGQLTFLYVTAKSILLPANITDIYQTARQLAPCMVILEDIDMIGGKNRDDQSQAAILNELLNQLDGLQGLKRLVTIGSSNDPTALDPALLRPGRFDVHIPIPLPSYLERIDLLKLATKGTKLDPSVDLPTLSNRTEGFSGAKLTDLVIRAKKFAARDGSVQNNTILLKAVHFEQALRELLRNIGG